MKRICAVLALMLAFGSPAWAAVVSAVPLISTGVNLSTTQTGNVDSTNTMDRGYTLGGPVLLRVTSTIGATPTKRSSTCSVRSTGSSMGGLDSP